MRPPLVLLCRDVCAEQPASGATRGDWITYGADLAGTKYTQGRIARPDVEGAAWIERGSAGGTSERCCKSNQLSRSKREAVRRDRGELTTGGLHTSLGSNALEGRHMAPDCGIRYRCITTPSRSVKLVRFNGIHGSRGPGSHRPFAQVVELATTYLVRLIGTPFR